MRNITITMTGTAPLLMHNSRLADKLDPITREKTAIAAKKKKTDEDDLALSRIEWMGGLYFDPEVGPYLPGDNILKSLIEAARKSRDGKRVEQGLFITTDVNPLVYGSKARTIDALWADENFVFRRTVKQQMSRITRTRPIFREWVTKAEGVYDPSVLNLDDVAEFATTAGAYIGVGDWRPRYGRFTAEVTGE